ncbi:MAG TPA: NADH-quinone oxidoreductase subunit G, partial [Ignavibacteria bacterium]|nr:NADH-quinone oxidoreductase subunit G [Ignavibacteria bacterium]
LSKKATVILPLSTYAEINGTFVNFQNMVQRIKPAVVTIEQERLPGDFSLSRLDKFGAHNDKWTHGTKFNARPAWKVLAQIARAMGHEFGYSNTEDVFDDIVSKVPEFAGLNYEVIGSDGAMIGKMEDAVA